MSWTTSSSPGGVVTVEHDREKQGLERLDQVKRAVLEVSGGISIVPKKNAASKA